MDADGSSIVSVASAHIEAVNAGTLAETESLYPVMSLRALSLEALQTMQRWEIADDLLFGFADSGAEVRVLMHEVLPRFSKGRSGFTVSDDDPRSSLLRQMREQALVTLHELVDGMVTWRLTSGGLSNMLWRNRPEPQLHV